MLAAEAAVVLYALIVIGPLALLALAAWFAAAQAAAARPSGCSRAPDQSPSGASFAFMPWNAKSSRSTIRNVVLFGPSVGRKAGSRTIEKLLPSIARWKVSATMRPPTPRSLPSFSSASRRT